MALLAGGAPRLALSAQAIPMSTCRLFELSIEELMEIPIYTLRIDGHNGDEDCQAMDVRPSQRVVDGKIRNRKIMASPTLTVRNATRDEY